MIQSSRIDLVGDTGHAENNSMEMRVLQLFRGKRLFKTKFI